LEQYNDIIRRFFDRTFELTINEKMFYRDYSYPQDEVLGYIRSVLDCPMPSFINYIRNYCSVPYLEYTDIVQYSSLADATIGISRAIDEHGDNGFTFVELGRFLLSDGIERNDIAYRKYGENHSKTAQEFGLTQLLYSKTYLTCIGKILPTLSELDQIQLLRRLALRNRYFKLIVVLSSREKIKLDSQMGLLAESTRIRRLPNVRKIWQLVVGEDQETANLLSNVSV